MGKPFSLVGIAGLEPARRVTSEPKSDASTNSTISPDLQSHYDREEIFSLLSKSSFTLLLDLFLGIDIPSTEIHQKYLKGTVLTLRKPVIHASNTLFVVDPQELTCASQNLIGCLVATHAL